MSTVDCRLLYVTRRLSLPLAVSLALQRRRVDSHLFSTIFLASMEVHLTLDQEALIRRAIASGRYQTAEDAVQDAMARWEEGERVRIEVLARLDEAEADLEARRYTDYSDEALPTLADELKREARALGE